MVVFVRMNRSSKTLLMSKLRFFIPITKIDRERRLVGGFATTEKLDKQNEVVDYEASRKAFGEWQGNLREMHEPKAVGRAIDIQEDNEGKRIYVTAKISKGAEDTWEKVKDGTLTGFSIGGQTLDKMSQIIKDTDTGESKQITRITKYKLNELSLVDNPANPDAQFELVKSGSKGRLIQTEILVSEDNENGNTVQKSTGEEDSKNEMAIMNKEVLAKLSTLLTEIGKVIKDEGSWEDDNSEVGGAKKTPNQTTEGKEVTAKADGDWEDPHPEVGGAKKTPKQTTEGKEVTAKADMESPEQGVETQEDEEHGAAPVTKQEDEDEEEEDTEKADMESPEQGVVTQEDEEHGAAPVTKTRKQAEDEEDEDEEDTEKAYDEDEEDEEERPKKRYTRKAHDEDEDEEEVEKQEGEEDEDEESDTEKLDRILEVVTTLRKRVTTLEKSPLPRKYRKIEKDGDNDGRASDAEKIQKMTDEVKAANEEARVTGRPLTPEMRQKKEWLINKSLDEKFGTSELKK